MRGGETYEHFGLYSYRTDRSSPIYRKFADLIGIRKDFTGILKAFGKGLSCSRSIRGLKAYGPYCAFWK